ncbi:MAG: hypothetical protein KF861_23325, partial [Planctomycetaceae bacterium]|nr:hypothetical protein [Planctomycetaceae bacterium]
MLYEFPGEETPAPSEPRPRRRGWIVVLVLCPVIAAAAWGIYRLEQMKLDTNARDAFKLETDFSNQVIVAIAKVSDLPQKSMAFLSDFSQLQLIDLGGTRSLEGNLESLKQFDQLRVLSLRNCPWVDDDVVAGLSEVSSLKRLDLSGTQVSDDGLRAISRLPQLSELNLERCQKVTDAGLQVCAEMPELRRLWVGGAGYTFDGLLTLRENRRNLNLQLKRDDVIKALVPGVDWSSSDYFSSNEGFSDPEFKVSATLTSDSDIAALERLLTFPQDWHYWPFVDAMLQNIPDVQDTTYVENIAQRWEVLALRGPAAARSLAAILPLAPKLTALSLYDTAMTTDHLSRSAMPASLQRLQMLNVSIDESLLRHISESAPLQLLSLSNVKVADSTRAGAETDATDSSERLSLPPLARMEIHNSPVSESFLRTLSQFRELSEVRLSDVTLSGIHDLNESLLAAENLPNDLLPHKIG